MTGKFRKTAGSGKPLIDRTKKGTRLRMPFVIELSDTFSIIAILADRCDIVKGVYHIQSQTFQPVGMPQ